MCEGLPFRNSFPFDGFHGFFSRGLSFRASTALSFVRCVGVVWAFYVIRVWFIFLHSFNSGGRGTGVGGAPWPRSPRGAYPKPDTHRNTWSTRPQICLTSDPHDFTHT